MNLTIPELALVVLVGASGAGKSTFARRHFRPTEVLSSDACRGLVSDDENDLAATKDAFDVLHFIAAKRLAAGRLTVVDATNVQVEARKPLLELARQYHCLPVAIVLDLPEQLCRERNRQRPDRNFGPHVIRRQRQDLRRSLRGLQREGFRHVFVLSTPEEVKGVAVERQPLRSNLEHERGPFDVIGDVHGCFDELVALLEQLGYDISVYVVRPPEGRKAIFLGDLVDRGLNVPDVLRLVMGMVEAGTALCVPGNHDVKLVRALRGRKVQVSHGLAESLAQLEREPPEFRERVATFLDGLVSHYVLDGGNLVVAHAGMREEMQGRGSGAVRAFALYGETTGEIDEFGLPVRANWAADYRGKAMVVYGHAPVPEPEWLNRTIDVDTGCVFGGRLTALRYPEKELVSVPAARCYYEPARPLIAGSAEWGTAPAGSAQCGTLSGRVQSAEWATASGARAEGTGPNADGSATGGVAPGIPHSALGPRGFRTPHSVGGAGLTAQQQLDDLLDIEDVLGKRVIATRLQRNVVIREENALAALEVMSRFAVNPKWLIYLPPTMSPSETTREPGLLEHPAEAFAYYRQEGVPSVVCEEKHMGSRAVVVVCRDEDAARRRFGIAGEGAGICYTRTGRRFFPDPTLEAELLARVRAAMGSAGLWERLNTDWVCLDCELLPWSAKAQELLRHQYAAVGAAAGAALAEAVGVLAQANGHGTDVGPLLARYRDRAENVERYVAAYRHYCWPVQSVTDLKLAPFHLLATEGAVCVDRDHVWHMETLAALCRADEAAHPGAPLFLATPYRVVDVTDPASQAAAVAWWEQLTGRGGEGIVVKPQEFVARGRRGLVQPAVKCRGREYLRIIYGPEYTDSAHLERLRARGLAAKRSLALRELALGVEALERFVRAEPLRRVHECVFGVLALESEPVDPRL